MLGGLLAPLRLPERVLEALDGLVESARELAPMHAELTRVREQTEPLGELGDKLERMNEDLGTKLDDVRDVVVALESERSHLNRTSVDMGAKMASLHEDLAPVGERLATIEDTVAKLASEVGAIHETLRGVKEDIQRTTGLRGQRGIAERARDALTGGHR